MIRGRGALLLLPLLACSDLTGSSGVVALELRLPAAPAVEPGDTVQLRARALDADGDSVAATILWLTPDASLVLDPTGLVTTNQTSGTGRVQAQVGSLRSDLALLTIRRRSDTLALTGALADTVAASDSASAPLVAAIQSLTPDTAGIGGSSILYEVVDTTAAKGNVRFAGGQLSLRATTGGNGGPLTPVTLRRVPGGTPPTQVDVRVSATRPSGALVPGSGQTISVIFE